MKLELKVSEISSYSQDKMSTEMVKMEAPILFFITCINLVRISLFCLRLPDWFANTGKLIVLVF